MQKEVENTFFFFLKEDQIISLNGVSSISSWYIYVFLFLFLFSAFNIDPQGTRATPSKTYLSESSSRSCTKNHHLEIHNLFSLWRITHSSHDLRNSNIFSVVHSYFLSSDPQFKLSKISYVQDDFSISH